MCISIVFCGIIVKHKYWKVLFILGFLICLFHSSDCLKSKVKDIRHLKEDNPEPVLNYSEAYVSVAYLQAFS